MIGKTEETQILPVLARRDRDEQDTENAACTFINSIDDQYMADFSRYYEKVMNESSGGCCAATAIYGSGKSGVKESLFFVHLRFFLPSGGVFSIDRMKQFC